ncbi:hypothetical protein CRYUN_Cryun35bG0025800 [Craigia yunnanensis]
MVRGDAYTDDEDEAALEIYSDDLEDFSMKRKKIRSPERGRYSQTYGGFCCRSFNTSFRIKKTWQASYSVTLGGVLLKLLMPESKGNIEWCPVNDSEYAIELVIGASSSDVSCLCSRSFCLNCKEEAHRSLTCDIIAKWIKKTNPESRTLSRIKMCNKPCPQCNRPIEKNSGSHGLSRKRAIKDLDNLKIEQTKKLSDIQKLDVSQLNFLEDAWQQIIDCRQILRWTYAYRCFLPKWEHAKIELLEFLQGQAESGLQRLHSWAERSLQQFLIADEPSKNFNDFRYFRMELIRRTSVTRNYFENLVKALENGLSDVDSKAIAARGDARRCPRKY